MSDRTYEMRHQPRTKEQLEEDKVRHIKALIDAANDIIQIRAGYHPHPFKPSEEDGYEDILEHVAYLQDVLDELDGITFHRKTDEDEVKNWYSEGYCWEKQ